MLGVAGVEQAPRRGENISSYWLWSGPLHLPRQSHAGRLTVSTSIRIMLFMTKLYNLFPFDPKICAISGTGTITYLLSSRDHGIYFQTLPRRTEKEKMMLKIKFTVQYLYWKKGSLPFLVALMLLPWDCPFLYLFKVVYATLPVPYAKYSYRKER